MCEGWLSLVFSTPRAVRHIWLTRLGFASVSLPTRMSLLVSGRALCVASCSAWPTKLQVTVRNCHRSDGVIIDLGTSKLHDSTMRSSHGTRFVLASSGMLTVSVRLLLIHWINRNPPILPRQGSLQLITSLPFARLLKNTSFDVSQLNRS